MWAPGAPFSGSTYFRQGNIMNNFDRLLVIVDQKDVDAGEINIFGTKLPIKAKEGDVIHIPIAARSGKFKIETVNG